MSGCTIKWIFIVLMWLGRLEIVPVIIMVMGIAKGLRDELLTEPPVQAEASFVRKNDEPA